MFRRRASLFVLAGLVLLAGTAAAQQARTARRFADVPPGRYFSEAVERFARLDVLRGYESGRFGPGDTVTRGQVAVMLNRYDREVVQPLRRQMERIRLELGMGFCGDGTVQEGEECDDGNIQGGDGCSGLCTEETFCPGGRRIGDTFPAPDGCNVCTCTRDGVSCTERACEQEKCFSSSDCAQGEICSTERGDCRFPCPEGAVCVQACAGVCIPESSPPAATCGDGVCAESETGTPDRTGQMTYCPEDCGESGPVCGNGSCEEGEADTYTIECSGSDDSCESVLQTRGTCPEDCEGGLSSCEQRRQAVDTVFENNRNCSDDADCTVFTRACSPYQTCGKAIRQDAFSNAQSVVEDYIERCGGDEPIVCAACKAQEAVCQEGTCTLREPEKPVEPAIE